MIRVVFSGKTVEEILDQIKAAAEGLIGVSPHQLTGSPTTATAVAAATEAKPPRTRKKKDEAADAPAATTLAAPAAPAPVAAAPAPAQSTQSTIEKSQLVAMLQKVNEKGGIPKAKEVLQRFGVTRISDVPTTRYADFLDECAKAIA